MRNEKNKVNTETLWLLMLENNHQKNATSLHCTYSNVIHKNTKISQALQTLKSYRQWQQKKNKKIEQIIILLLNISA